MPKERPRSRLVVLADILGITIKPGHVSRGGQVTRSFFLEVASAIGLSGKVVSVSDVGPFVGILGSISTRFG